MHKLFSLVALVLFLIQHPIIHAETTQTTPTKTHDAQNNPIFAPPLDNEPVFPLEIEPPNEQTNKFMTEFLNMLATLGIVIAIIFFVAWFLKRMMNTRLEQQNNNSSIKIVERRMLSPKTSLYLLEIDNKRVLIGESQMGVSALTEYEAPISEESKPDTEFPSAFSKFLDRKK